MELGCGTTESGASSSLQDIILTSKMRIIKGFIVSSFFNTTKIIELYNKREQIVML